MTTNATPTVLFAGNPNAGKTTLFNLLTGARAKVGNYPGVTVDRREAKLKLDDGSHSTVVDLPGAYSLTARSAEERVAIEALLAAGSATPAAVVVVLDATTLGRGLYFATQVLEVGLPTVIALTMIDEAKKLGMVIDHAKLAASLGCAVVPVVATRGDGKDELVRAIRDAVTSVPARSPLRRFDAELEADITVVEDALVAATMGSRSDEAAKRRLRVLAQWALLSIGDDELTGVAAGVREAVERVRSDAKRANRDVDRELVTARYKRVDPLLRDVLGEKAGPVKRLSSRIDDVLVHPVWGLLVFVGVMFVVFQALFAWAEPLMGLIESGVDALSAFAKAELPEGAFTDLLVNGIIAGVGNVVVFVPQIAILFVFITLLEDSGYLARVAFVIDRIMAKVGLNGKAFVPMLSGFACAIPAVMATRTIESRRDRLLTMLVVPLMSCSARLPIYVLMTSVVFDPSDKVFGFLSTGALVLFAMYVTSVVAALGVAFVLGRTALKGPRPTLVIELPPYRMPRAINIGRATTSRVRRFLADAGTVILALTILLWALLNYPKDSVSEARFEQMRAVATADADEEARQAALAEIDAEQAGERLRNSAAGRAGRLFEPALEPLGFDWKIGVGLIGAFAAREVFVSTLGLVYDVSDATEEDQGLHAKLRAAKHRDGSRVFTPLTGVALMVFFVLACQCMSTLAVVRRESGSWKWPAFMFGYMTSLAYLVTLVVYQVGRAFGWGV
ncbi:MAG: ferrous iron transport protein B [Polyangiaceae bacterium]|nr:ferrous iron transport protein B [Polyangiaceae bacterium]